MHATIVTWTLEPVAGGTRLRLEHTGFDTTDQETARGAQYGWKGKLDKDLPAVLTRLSTLGLTPTRSAD